MENFDYIFVRIISGKSNNSDPECNLHFSIVTKHHSCLCSIKDENYLVIQFWVHLIEWLSILQENNDQLEVKSTRMLLVKEEYRIMSHSFSSLVSTL